jgi:hypothetical protein
MCSKRSITSELISQQLEPEFSIDVFLVFITFLREKPGGNRRRLHQGEVFFEPSKFPGSEQST